VTAYLSSGNVIAAATTAPMNAPPAIASAFLPRSAPRYAPAAIAFTVTSARKIAYPNSR
jgi:hypothetical protein